MAQVQKVFAPYFVDLDLQAHQSPPEVAGLADGGFMDNWVRDAVTGPGSILDYSVRAQAFSVTDVDLVLETQGQTIAKTAAEFEAYDRIVTFDTPSHLNDPVSLKLTGPGALDLTDELEIAGGGARGVAIGASGVGNTITTGAGDDTLNGGARADDLSGGAGNDRLEGGNGTDTLRGGAGNDTLTDGGTDGAGSLMYGGLGDDTLRITGSGAYTGPRNEERWDVLHGDEGNDTLDAGNSTFFILHGGAGHDTLLAGPNRFGFLLGEDGDDRLDASRTDPGTYNITLDGGAGNDTVIGSAGDDSMLGGEGSDRLFGGDGNDDIAGGDGDDLIVGGAGNDTLLGLGGVDTLTGGTGVDTFVGTDVSNANNTQAIGSTLDADTITDYESGEKIFVGTTLSSIDQFQFTKDGANGVLRIDVDNDGRFETALTLLGVSEGDLVLTQGWGGSAVQINITSSTPTPGNDVLLGTTGLDVIDGLGGDDRISGLAGDDLLHGGAGNDTLDGDAGIDNLFGDADNDVLHGGADTDLLFGGAGNDRLNGDAGVDTLQGEAGDDTLNGGADVDFLYGGDGFDVLDGGEGSDLLSGGAETDVFVFSTALNAASNVDRILDFEISLDRIVLDHTIFAALTFGPLSPSKFGVGAAASNQQNIVYDKNSGALFYDADGAGGEEQVQFATVSPGLNLTASDFFVT